MISAIGLLVAQLRLPHIPNLILIPQRLTGRLGLPQLEHSLCKIFAVGVPQMFRAVEFIFRSLGHS